MIQAADSNCYPYLSAAAFTIHQRFYLHHPNLSKVQLEVIAPFLIFDAAKVAVYCLKSWDMFEKSSLMTSFQIRCQDIAEGEVVEERDFVGMGLLQLC